MIRCGRITWTIRQKQPINPQRRNVFECGGCRQHLNLEPALGHELRRPEADYLRDGIYELRVGLRGINYRMLYFFHGKVAAVLAHGLVKEREVPPREVEEAIRRKRKFELDPGRHTYKES